MSKINSKIQIVSAFLFALCVTQPVLSATGEWWEVTSSMEMPDMPPEMAGMMGGMGTNTFRVCIGKGEEGNPKFEDKNSKCVVSDQKRSGNTTTFKMKCTGKNAGTMSGERTSTANSFIQKMKMQSDGDNMTMIANGKKMGGNCTVGEATAEQKQMQSDMQQGMQQRQKAVDNIMADQKLATAQTCKDALIDEPKIIGYGKYFFDYETGRSRSVPMCKDDQAEYCKLVRSVIKTFAGYEEYDNIKKMYASDPKLGAGMFPVDALKACKIAAPVVNGYCKSAMGKANIYLAAPTYAIDSDDKAKIAAGSAASEALHFLENFCPADFSAFYQKTCGAHADKSGDAYDRNQFCNPREEKWKGKGVNVYGSQSSSPPNQVAPAADAATPKKSTEPASPNVAEEVMNEGSKALKNFFKF